MIGIRPYKASDADMVLSWCQYGSKKVSPGVFENNPPAYYYKAAGFSAIVLDTTEKYDIPGEAWKCRELIMENRYIQGDHETYKSRFIGRTSPRPAKIRSRFHKKTLAILLKMCYSECIPKVRRR